MKLTLRQLELFIEIAKQQNITQAAEIIGITQSAASMALSELETRLDILLFDRLGKNLVLNANGEDLLPKAIEIIEKVKEIEHNYKYPSSHLSGHLKIGASSTIGNYLLPAIICQFKKAHPEVKIMLQVGNTQQITNELLRFNLDIGFIEGACELPELLIKPWREDELVIFTAKKHFLNKKQRLTLHDLQKAGWILREPGSGTREIFEKNIHQHIPQLQVTLELGSTEAIKQAVKEGIGISCLSRFALSQEVQNGEFVVLPFKKIAMKRNLYQILHSRKFHTRLLQEFQKFCDVIQK